MGPKRVLEGRCPFLQWTVPTRIDEGWRVDPLRSMTPPLSGHTHHSFVHVIHNYEGGNPRTYTTSTPCFLHFFVKCQFPVFMLVTGKRSFNRRRICKAYICVPVGLRRTAIAHWISSCIWNFISSFAWIWCFFIRLFCNDFRTFFQVRKVVIQRCCCQMFCRWRLIGQICFATFRCWTLIFC